MNIVAVVVIVAVVGVVALVERLAPDLVTIQRLAVLIFAIAALRQLLRRQ